MTKNEWVEKQLGIIRGHPVWEGMAPFADRLYAAASRLCLHGLMVDCGTGEGGSASILALGTEVNAGGPVFSIDIRGAARRNAVREIAQSGLGTGFIHYCRFIQAHSVRAAGDFADESVSLLVLDSRHTRAHVLSELEAWGPKVISGGEIWVHDYTNSSEGFGPQQAVTEFLRKHPEFILSVLTEPPGFAILTKGDDDGNRQDHVLHNPGDGGPDRLHDETRVGGDQGDGDRPLEEDGGNELQSLPAAGFSEDQGQGAGDSV